MASADLRLELRCSICLNIFTDPVTLRCGHNFCRGCVDHLVINTRRRSRVYSCPECRAKFPNRPALQRNINLHKVAEHFRSTQPEEEEEEEEEEKITGICCTYCVDSPVPAVKSCLHCEASLCDKHVKVHSKSPEHVLTDPSISSENRKCSIHKKILEYYCTEDSACICVSCCLIGEHNGHKMQSLEEASEKKKSKMRNILQKLTTKREKTGERVQSLEKHRRKAQEKASGEAERVTALFIQIRSQLEDLEKRVLSEISRQEEQLSLSLSEVIQKLEIEKDELSRKMRHIEELCNMTDPLTVLQDPDTGDPEEQGGEEDTGGHDGGEEDTGGHDGGDEDTGGHVGGDEVTGGHDKTHDVDVDAIKGMLHATFSDIMANLQTVSPAKQGNKRKHRHRDKSPPSHTQAKRKFKATKKGPANVLLDVNTAANNLLISDDLRTATWTPISEDRPETAERFQDYCQVMSRRGFTSGRHYWDVEISGSDMCRVGVCYPSIDRSGGCQSYFGRNNKSWCLWRGSSCNRCSLVHDDREILFPHEITSNKFRIHVDYEAGQLSFYELCDSIRHLHTFTATFTEPLHAALHIWEGFIKIASEPRVGKKHRRKKNRPKD